MDSVNLIRLRRGQLLHTVVISFCKIALLKLALVSCLIPSTFTHCNFFQNCLLKLALALCLILTTVIHCNNLTKTTVLKCALVFCLILATFTYRIFCKFTDNSFFRSLNLVNVYTM